MLNASQLKLNKLIIFILVLISFDLHAQWINSGGGFASTKTTNISSNGSLIFWSGDFLCNAFFEANDTTYKLENNT